MKVIIEYLLAAIKALLAIFNVELPELEEGTEENIGTMIDNIMGYEPEV